ncbi:MAG: TetR/AcrR family transcriptional regulator [Synergistaceae bacterium]|jgi:TetR/AcrR family acrAB operon transcriptional repressor|nr:TetR/AcrR family transcriptional regulator [Synergistaceae bacterium]
MRKTKESAGETRKKLLESALDEMSEKPFPNVSMNNIAARVGLSKGALYWHFKNKNDLLINLVEDICEKTGMNCRNVGPVPKNFDGLRIFFRKKMLSGAKNEQSQKVNKLVHRGHEWPAEVFERLVSSMRGMIKNERDMLEGIIAKSQQRHEIKTDFPAGEIASLLSAIFHGLFFLQIHEIYGTDFIKYSDFIFDALKNGLKTD